MASFLCIGFFIEIFYLYVPLCYDIRIINIPFIATQFLQHVSPCITIIRYYSCKILRGTLSAIVRLTAHSVVSVTAIIVTACGLYIAVIWVLEDYRCSFRLFHYQPFVTYVRRVCVNIFKISWVKFFIRCLWWYGGVSGRTCSVTTSQRPLISKYRNGSRLRVSSVCRVK